MGMPNPALMDFEERVMETVKSLGERRDPPLIWVLEVAKCIQDNGFGLPSLELGQLLVSNLCFPNNNPAVWKLIEQGISSRLLSSLQVLALLTSRVLPHRRSQPEAYRLYLELLSRFAFSFGSAGTDSCKEKIIKSVDDALQLSHTYALHLKDIGHMAVLFLFSSFLILIDSTLEDWGLQLPPTDKLISIHGGSAPLDMDIDTRENPNDKRKENREQLRRMNSLMAIEVLAKLTENKKAMIVLRLVYLNMPVKFNSLLKRLQFLNGHKMTPANLKAANQLLVRLTANIQRAITWEYQLNKRQMVGLLIDIGPCNLTSFNHVGPGRTASWIPFDIYMEGAMDMTQLPAKSAVDILSVFTKTLQVINRATWQETFQALWVSALRLVQRERDPQEGPVPHLDARLCVLLSITPLAVVRVVEEQSENLGYDSKKLGLISSLQVLGQFSGLLLPPASVVIAANNAASKAENFISNVKSGSDASNGVGCGEFSVKAVGNMQHLIVEACIARKLIDTSAYFWPGYVTPSPTLQTDPLPVQGSPWSTFMNGAPLNGPLKNALIATPASSLAEVEKVYHIALNGSDEEKSVAAKILCGASLSRGWDIQEHVVNFAVKLLSPPAPSNFVGPGSHLIAYMSMLYSTLLALSSFDIVHILSLYGMVPEVAASLMPICEAFGSLVPASSHQSSMNDETSVYAVFSCAFLFLLRLWKFYRPPYEHCIVGRGGSTWSVLTLEYLLLLRNSRVPLYSSSDPSDRTPDPLDRSYSQPVYIESFPKLRAWYSQNQACIASTLSGLCSGNPVHQVANKILSMIYWKITKCGTKSSNPSTTSSGSVCGSPVNADEFYQRPILPAWEVLEAIPFVTEAVLTACAHGRLSSRDLTTGLRDLVDFIPASLAAIISYFCAEITRGIWKHVPMNGTDWPSPAANFHSVVSEIKDILASAGVNCPSCCAGETLPAMLPLPMAALVSLTITFKLDKSLDYIHGVSGISLENCASGCPWPSMPIVGALWAQKVRRWHDFIVISCCRSVFKLNQEAVAQLIRSCFSSFLEPQSVSSSPWGVTGLLGDSMFTRGSRTRIAPGFLYLRSCRMIHNLHFVNDLILALVAEWGRELATWWSHSESPHLKSNHASLASAAARVKEVATIGASLLCAAGGIQLVQLLYQETMPTWLLSMRGKLGSSSGPASLILEGYALAYFLVICGSIVWGVKDVMAFPMVFSRRPRVLGSHMDFIAGVIEGNISLGCDPITWKAYVSCFVGLVVSFAPAWISEVKPDTLRKLANGLRGWHECELALALLERGGEAAMGSVAEMFM